MEAERKHERRERGITCNRGPQPDSNQGHCSYVAGAGTIWLPRHSELFLKTCSQLCWKSNLWIVFLNGHTGRHGEKLSMKQEEEVIILFNYGVHIFRQFLLEQIHNVAFNSCVTNEKKKARESSSSPGSCLTSGQLSKLTAWSGCDGWIVSFQQLQKWLYAVSPLIWHRKGVKRRGFEATQAYNKQFWRSIMTS